MATYPLTERQKTLLRSLGPGLRSGEVENTWIVVHDRGKIAGIRGLVDPTGELWRDTWDGVSDGDLQAFVNSQLFYAMPSNMYAPTTKYSLNAELILRAIDSDFVIDDWFAPIRPVQPIEVNANNSIVNINSILSNTAQTIQHSLFLSEADRQTFAGLMTALTEQLTAVAEQKPDEAEAIAQQAQDIAEQAAADKPNRARLKISRDGLIAAAQTVAAIAPPVIETAKRIASVIEPYLGR